MLKLGPGKFWASRLQHSCRKTNAGSSRGLWEPQDAAETSHSSQSAMGLTCHLGRPRFSKPQHLSMLFLVLCLDLVGTRRAELTAAVPVPAVLSLWLQMWPLWLGYIGSYCRDLRSLLFPSLK